MAAHDAGACLLNRIIEENLPLVENVVMRVSAGFPRFVDRAELVAAGTLGLVEAGRRYDPSAGIPFAQFAARRVRGAVLDALRQADWAPRSVRALTRKVEAAEQALAIRNRRRPDDHELADASGVSVEELAELRARVQQGALMTLDLASDDSDACGAANRLHDRSASTPDENVESAEERGYVRDALRNLPQRLRTVAVGIYLENRSFDELADGLGVTPSRVSQLRSEAVTMIREGVEAQYVPAESDGQTGGRVARRKATFAAEISRASTWRQRLMAAEECIVDAPAAARG